MVYIIVKYCSKLLRPIVSITGVLRCVAECFKCTQFKCPGLFKGANASPSPQVVGQLWIL